MDREWEDNPNWQKLGTPSVGDIVQLKETSGFPHLVNIIVSSVTGNDISGVVEAVFDWQDKGRVTESKSLNLARKEMKFSRQLIHNIIKKPARIQ
jgi:hypothetical protein